MKSQIITEDNSCKHELELPQLNALSQFAGVSLSDLCKSEPQLLIFPHSLGANEDDIGKQNLFDVAGRKLKTGNVMGFFCIDDIQIAIHSRFDKSEKQYFLHYMLQKVLGINILNFENHMGSDELWEFLIYILPYCLVRALQQGVFRAYRQYEHNDSRIKGAVDVARHLKLNLPFNGKITYRMREYSADNPMMQLIRHTIEFIKNDPHRATILCNSTEIKEAVALIVEVTPTYNSQERGKVIFQNLRGGNHPYFTEYTVLRNLCLRILRHDKVSTGNDDKHIRGIVFDGAWLWEEYLATLLKPMGFEHPENKTGKGARYPFKGDERTGPMFPDFIGKNAVLDAKYKRLDSTIAREDRFQMISYMHVLNLTKGFLLYPAANRTVEPLYNAKELEGLGGMLGSISFYVPEKADFLEFSAAMKVSEAEFCNNVKKCTDE